MAKILIIDDSEVLRTQLRKDLEKANHAVSEASDAFQGIEILSRSANAFDLLILDYRMPKLNGFDMLEEVKDKMVALNIPIFVLTCETKPDASLSQYLRSIGIRAWFVKPYVPQKLLNAIASTVNVA